MSAELGAVIQAVSQERGDLGLQALLAESYTLQLPDKKRSIQQPAESASAVLTSSGTSAAAHASRVATIFRTELEEIRQADPDFVGTVQQVTLLRDALMCDSHLLDESN